MLKKIKSLFKKHWIIILIVSLILILLTVVLIFLMSKQAKEDEENISNENPTYVRTPVVYYEEYEVSVSDDIVRKINTYETSYSTFIVKKVDHVKWVENFVNTIKGNQLIYTKKAFPALKGDDLHTLDQSLHYWEKGNDFVFYDVQKDTLLMKFESPVTVPNIQIDSSSEESVQKALDDINSTFFSSRFDCQVDEIYREGNYYKIEYSRVLDGLPVFMNNTGTYLLVSPDGRLKEARFLLAEFASLGTASLIAGEELRDQINTQGYNKTVAFDFVDPSVNERLGEDEYGYEATGQEKANVTLKNVELFYYYTGKFQEKAVSSFFFEGSGTVEIDDEKIDANFRVHGDAVFR